MKLINFLKGFTCFIIFYSLCVNASDNQCKEIDGIAYHCAEDENGKIYKVGFKFGNQSNNKIEKLFSYKTISELYIQTEYYTMLTQDIINKIGELSNLKILDINGNYSENLNFEPFKKLENLTYLDITGKDYKIPKHVLKYLNNLKELNITHTKLNQNDIADINSLTKLEKLNLFTVNFEKDLDYNSNFNIKELTFHYCEFEKNFLKSLKNLKILIDKDYNNLKQYHIDEIATLSNLEEISLDTVDKELNINEFKNLKNLKSCNLSVDGNYLKNIKDVKH